MYGSGGGGVGRGGAGGVVSIDKFGRTLHTSSWSKLIDGAGMLQRGVGLPLTSSGDYDIQGRRLCNVQSPSLEHDCVVKLYVDDMFKTFETTFNNKITKTRAKLQDNRVLFVNLRAGFEDLEIKYNELVSELQTLRDKIVDSKKYIDLQVSGNLKPSIEAIEDQILNLTSSCMTDIKNLHTKIDAGDVKITEISNELNDATTKLKDSINRNYSDVSVTLTQLSDQITKIGEAFKSEFANLINKVDLNKSNIEDVTNLLDPSKTGQIASIIKTVNTDIPLNINRITNHQSVMDTLISNIRHSIAAQISRVDLMDSAISSRLDILEKKVGLGP